MKRVPFLPHLLAVSKTGRCSGFRSGAPSTVIVPQMCSLASSIWARVKPRAVSRLNPGLPASAMEIPARASASSPRVQALKANGSSKTPGSDFSTLVEVGVGEALRLQALAVDVRRTVEREGAEDVSQDGLALVGAVAEVFQGRFDTLVGDLEVAAAGEFLELHQREVRLDAGGVAVHQQADGAGRRQQGRLRVAVAVVLAQARARSHDFAGRGSTRSAGARSASIPIGGDGELLVLGGGRVVGGAAVVADHAQH